MSPRLLLVLLVGCVPPEEPRQPEPEPPPVHVYNPPVVQEPQVVFGHVTTPLPDPPDSGVVVEHDPHECEDPRIAAVLSSCTPHLELKRLYYHCPRTLDYNVRRFGEVAMGGLTERCNLPVRTPVQDRPCHIEVVRGEIYHDRHGVSHEPTPLEICVQ